MVVVIVLLNDVARPFQYRKPGHVRLMRLSLNHHLAIAAVTDRRDCGPVPAGRGCNLWQDLFRLAHDADICVEFQKGSAWGGGDVRADDYGYARNPLQPRQ